MIAQLVAIRVVRRLPPTIIHPSSVTLTTEMRVDDEALYRLVHMLRNGSYVDFPLAHARRATPPPRSG